MDPCGGGRVMALRGSIREKIHRLVGGGEHAIVDVSRPPGDDGLFGPASAAWRVHGDVTAMMVGGVSALLLQMLHPAALAGVWEHSRFLEDPGGRLKRTAGFIAVTTYGASATAEAAIAKVRAIHERVSGTLPDGTPYCASDPRLLTWVHVAEVRSFLAAHIAYREPGFPAARQEAYLAEMATLARRLGAENVPATRREVAAYLEAMRPELVTDARTRETAAALLDRRLMQGPMAAAGDLMLHAGVVLLPGWAARMHGRMPTALGGSAARIGARGLGEMVRWAMAG